MPDPCPFCDELTHERDTARARVRELEEVLRTVLHADGDLPGPRVSEYPPDQWMEQYRDWYHGARYRALDAARAEEESDE